MMMPATDTTEPFASPSIPLPENSLAVLKRRYLRRGPDGQPIETVEEMFRRVAHHIAIVEAEHGADVEATEEAFYKLLTELRFKRTLAARVPHDGLAPIAPAGTAADAVGLQQHHAHAPLCELQRGRQASETAAHHQRVGLQRALQRRLGRGPANAVFVIAFLVELGVGMDERGGHGRYFQQRQQ